MLALLLSASIFVARGWHWTGTVVAVDKDEHPVEVGNGSIEFGFQGGGSIETTIDHGRWELTLPQRPYAPLYVVGAWIGDRPARCDGCLYCPPEPRDVVLSLRVFERCTLRVVNAKTGRDISGFELRRRCDEGGLEHTSFDVCPIVLPPFDADEFLFFGQRSRYDVCAPGFEPQSIWIAAQDGGDRVVRMIAWPK